MRIIHISGCTLSAVFVALAASVHAADAPVVAVRGGGFTIYDAINQAVTTHPGVGEAAANRRATEAEMRQTQGTMLPQVRLEARTGRQRFDYRDAVPPLAGNATWMNSRDISIVGRQLLFDGLTSIYDTWRQAARVDAAAFRVRERTELIALDASEAYIDVVRYTRLVALANENVRTHRQILSNVDARFQGGRAGEGDLEQVRERVEAALAAQAQFLEQLDEARGKYRRTVGIEPYNLRVPGRLHNLPASKDAALATTLRHNPTIQAGEADRTAARHAFDSTTGSFLPNVALEARASRGTNIGTILGDRTEASAFVVATWDIFRGGQNAWRRAEFAERYQEQTMRHARLQREAFELIDKAWAARTITNERIATLLRQIAADRRVITAYQQEYELGQRSLIDLLNAQNQLFNAQVSLESARGIAVFADFQLLAAMGQLLPFLNQPHPVDAEPLQTRPIAVFPFRLPPILVSLPKPGSEPLNISAAHAALHYQGRGGALTAYAAAEGGMAGEQARPQAGTFQNRWPFGNLSWFDSLFQQSGGANEANSSPREAASPQASPAADHRGAPAGHGQPLELVEASAFAPAAPAHGLPAWLSAARSN